MTSYCFDWGGTQMWKCPRLGCHRPKPDIRAENLDGMTCVSLLIPKACNPDIEGQPSCISRKSVRRVNQIRISKIDVSPEKANDTSLPAQWRSWFWGADLEREPFGL